MTRIFAATVQGGRIDVPAPPDWPDGTEGHVHLVCRAKLTPKDYPRTVEEMIAIDNLIAEEEGSGASHAPSSAEPA